MLKFPVERPDQRPVEVWSIQQLLLRNAEQMLGPRDLAKKIYQPVFKDNGPILINTPNFDGAFAALSMNAAGYWPTFVYELAHETVHLLNPVKGYTNYLEEGIAVAFSVEMSHRLTSHPMAPRSSSVLYCEALQLVQALPISCFDAAKTIRNRVTALSAVTLEILCECFPSADETILAQLAAECHPR